MAVLSVPSNTPTVDGATAVCVSDDATGTVYLSVRTDRAWYSVANGDSQELVDEDKAMIISGATYPPVVWSGNQAASLDPEQLIDGLDARLDPEAPYYVGWVQEQSSDTTAPVITAVSHNTPGETTATITWTTNEPATSSVEYGETAGLGTTEPATPDATLRTSHSVALSGLTNGTLHYYDVTSVDAAANSATESGTPFTTASSNIYGDKYAIEVFIDAADQTFTLPKGYGTTYSATVDWGDGLTDEVTSASASLLHNYAASGTKIITIDGQWGIMDYGTFLVEAEKITELLNLGAMGPTNFVGWCRGMVNATSITVGATNNNAPATNFGNLFFGASSVTTADVSGLDTSTATTLLSAFLGWTSFEGVLDVSGFDVALVQTFNTTFSTWTASLAGSGSIVGLSTWDISAATSMTSFLNGTKISTAELDAILVAWSALTIPGLSTGIDLGVNNTYSNTTEVNAAYASLEGQVGTLITGGHA